MLNNVTLNFPRFIYTNDNNAQFSNNSALSISSRGGRNVICSFCVVALPAGSADGDHSVHFYFYVVNQSLRVMNVDLYVNGLCSDCPNFIQSGAVQQGFIRAQLLHTGGYHGGSVTLWKRPSIILVSKFEVDIKWMRK